MRYYKVVYRIAENNEWIYPSIIKGAVWNIAQYHFTENVMIGGTESKVEAEGEDVVELTEKKALSQIEEFKNSYPEVSGEEQPFLPENKDEPEPVRTISPRKKRSR